MVNLEHLEFAVCEAWFINLYRWISCENRMNRHTDIKRESEPPAELESQFILRIPPVRTVSSM
jgi:hypothetical protein